jgi:hypothetical protein
VIYYSKGFIEIEAPQGSPTHPGKAGRPRHAWIVNRHFKIKKLVPTLVFPNPASRSTKEYRSELFEPDASLSFGRKVLRKFIDNAYECINTPRSWNNAFQYLLPSLAQIVKGVRGA